jgi:hypothetical protein
MMNPTKFLLFKTPVAHALVFLFLCLLKGGSEPDWVLTEREHFVKFRDRNGDGLMDLDEVD